MRVHLDEYKSRTSRPNSSVYEVILYPNMTLLYFATHLAFNASDGGFPSDDFRKILHEDQRMANVQMAKVVLPKVSTF